MKNDKIKLTKDIKASLIKILHKGEITVSELHELFPEAIREQPLFTDLVTKEEAKQINDYLEDYC